MEKNKSFVVGAGNADEGIEMVESNTNLDHAKVAPAPMKHLKINDDRNESASSMHISQAMTTSEAGIVLHKSRQIHVNLSGLEDDNFKHMMAYPGKLIGLFVWGFITLLGGSVA
jgi:hypothetical protein